MKLLKPIFAAIFAFVTTCATAQSVDVSVNYAAKYFLKPDTNTVVVINQFNPTQLGGNKKTVAVLKEAVYAAISHAAFQLGVLPHTRIINMVDSVALTPNTDSIKQIAAKYHANYVLALKNFFAEITLFELGSNETTYNTNATADFMLYEDNGIFYRKLSGKAEDPLEQTVNAGIIASLIFQPTIKGHKDEVKAAAQHAAENALQDFFPFYITHTRPLFDDKFLRPINKEIIAGNFDKADSLLQPYLVDPDVKIASKAAYTLAIIYESENNLEDATDMAEESNSKNKNSYATAMLADLKEE